MDCAHQASLSITNSQSLLKLMSITLVMPPNHLIFCHPLLLPSIFPSIRIFSNAIYYYNATYYLSQINDIQMHLGSLSQLI